ncbi:TIGR02444 family protein [Spongiibacter sp. KMU-158]|uniref:TIGR02444 family protein n=1 Tax=Spongiibacter pelagi TaxID=2760804 RepID=A0A927GU95_9GAMM|nr:TIGR02444 family protein [Spongiibacter pelagi]MBD2857371.1 TIGR02444 family protein [Spongiibacter pelagi]
MELLFLQSELEKALWQFALERYGREGVEAICLELQDRYGFNVSLLLTLAFLGGRGWECSLEVVGSLSELAEDVERNALRDLRERRRQAKTQSSAGEYEGLKRLELEAEQKLMKALLESLNAELKMWELCDNTGDQAAIWRNFAHYLELNPGEGRGELLQKLAALLQ